MLCSALVGGDSVGGFVGGCVVGAVVGGDLVGGFVGDCAVGAIVGGDAVGGFVGDCVVGAVVGGDLVGAAVYARLSHFPPVPELLYLKMSPALIFRLRVAVTFPSLIVMS